MTPGRAQRKETDWPKYGPCTTCDAAPGVACANLGAQRWNNDNLRPHPGRHQTSPNGS